MKTKYFPLFLMFAFLFYFISLGSVVGCGAASGGGGGGVVTGEVKIFFLHHSVGFNLIDQGGVRASIEAYNEANDTTYHLWDHGYNADGLTDWQGTATGTDFAIPNDSTDVADLAYLFTSTNADAVSARNKMLYYDVIVFKSCFPNGYITDADMLQTYKDHYLAIRDFMDAHPDKMFVVMGFPPLHRMDPYTNSAERARARAFADWLKGTFVTGHSNIWCFDIFDYFAALATYGSDIQNALKYNYEIDHVASEESHPNELANQTVGPVFAYILIGAAAHWQDMN